MPGDGNNFLNRINALGGATDAARIQREQQLIENTQARATAQGQVQAGTHRASEAEIEKSAKEFEALLLQQMLKGMWNSVPQGGLLSGSREEELYRDMLNEQIAKDMASKQGLGIAKVVAREMKKREGYTKE